MNDHIEEAAKLKKVEVLLVHDVKLVKHAHVATDYKVEDREVRAGAEAEVGSDEDGPEKVVAGREMAEELEAAE